MNEYLKIIWSIVAFSLINIATGFYWFGSTNTQIINMRDRLVRIENRLDNIK